MKPLTDREKDVLVVPIKTVATLLDHFARFLPGHDPQEVLAFVTECAAEWRASQAT